MGERGAGAPVAGRLSPHSALENPMWGNRVPWGAEEGPQGVLPESSAYWVLDQPEVGVTWKVGAWQVSQPATSSQPTLHVIPINTVSILVFFSI